MPNRMQLRSVPPVPIGADRTGPDRAIIRVRAGHDEPLKPRTLAAVLHSINPQRARRARPGRSVSTWRRYDAYPMSPPPSRAHLVHPARSTDPAQLAQRLHTQQTRHENSYRPAYSAKHDRTRGRVSRRSNPAFRSKLNGARETGASPSRSPSRWKASCFEIFVSFDHVGGIALIDSWVSPLGWWDFGAEADRVREGLGVSLRVLGWAIA